MKYSLTGILPVAPTPFLDDGRIDTEGMKRVLDCMIDQGVAAICILANNSKQFLLSDEECTIVTSVSLDHVAGRIIANGFPTEVEVCVSMIYGGPYPASKNFGATSVGTLAIRQFLRPASYQNTPTSVVPKDLAS